MLKLVMENFILFKGVSLQNGVDLRTTIVGAEGVKSPAKISSLPRYIMRK